MEYYTSNDYIAVTDLDPKWIAENHPVMDKHSFVGRSGRVLLSLPIGVSVTMKTGEILTLRGRGGAETPATVETNFPPEKSCIQPNGFGYFEIC